MYFLRCLLLKVSEKLLVDSFFHILYLILRLNLLKVVISLLLLILFL